jgi:hypothetical protein
MFRPLTHECGTDIELSNRSKIISNLDAVTRNREDHAILARWMQLCRSDDLAPFPISGAVIAVYLPGVKKKERIHFVEAMERYRFATTGLFVEKGVIRSNGIEAGYVKQWNEHVTNATWRLGDWMSIQELLPPTE